MSAQNFYYKLFLQNLTEILLTFVNKNKLNKNDHRLYVIKLPK